MLAKNWQLIEDNFYLCQVTKNYITQYFKKLIQFEFNIKQ